MNWQHWIIGLLGGVMFTVTYVTEVTAAGIPEPIGGVVRYVELRPTFVTNFGVSDSGHLHYIKADVTVCVSKKESEEAAILQVYLPPALSEADVQAIVREAIEAGATEMGAVMGQIMPKIRGRFDGKEANRIVREELA